VAPTTLAGHAILVGFGRVGAIVGNELKDAGTPFLVIEEADKRVASTRTMRIEVIDGNAANPSVLQLANPGGAKSLIVAIPDAFEAGRIAANARKANPKILIIARAHSDAEVEHLIKHGADTVIMGEREIALAMIEWMQEKAAPGQ
jgi:monovalent cation:H+ antiporter-2, CPA2 family